jgi:hypothetical protein
MADAVTITLLNVARRSAPPWLSLARIITQCFSGNDTDADAASTDARFNLSRAGRPARAA